MIAAVYAYSKTVSITDEKTNGFCITSFVIIWNEGNFSEEIVKSSLFEKITSYIGIGGRLTEIPFTVTGTLDNVKFKIEYEGLLKSGGNNGGSKSLKDLGKSILEDILK